MKTASLRRRERDAGHGRGVMNTETSRARYSTLHRFKLSLQALQPASFVPLGRTQALLVRTGSLPFLERTRDREKTRDRDREKDKRRFGV